MLFKFSCSLYEEDGEEEPLFYRILENHLNFAQKFHGDYREQSEKTKYLSFETI